MRDGSSFVRVSRNIIVGGSSTSVIRSVWLAKKLNDLFFSHSYLYRVKALILLFKKERSGKELSHTKEENESHRNKSSPHEKQQPFFPLLHSLLPLPLLKENTHPQYSTLHMFGIAIHIGCLPNLRIYLGSVLSHMKLTNRQAVEKVGESE